MAEVQDPHFARERHWLPYKTFWVPLTAADQPEGPTPHPPSSAEPPEPKLIRIYSNSFDSNKMCRVNAEIRAQPHQPSDTPHIQYIVLPMGAWSHSGQRHYGQSTSTSSTSASTHGQSLRSLLCNIWHTSQWYDIPHLLSTKNLTDIISCSCLIALKTSIVLNTERHPLPRPCSGASMSSCRRSGHCSSMTNSSRHITMASWWNAPMGSYVACSCGFSPTQQITQRSAQFRPPHGSLAGSR